MTNARSLVSGPFSRERRQLEARRTDGGGTSRGCGSVCVLRRCKRYRDLHASFERINEAWRQLGARGLNWLSQAGRQVVIEGATEACPGDNEY